MYAWLQGVRRKGEAKQSQDARFIKSAIIIFDVQNTRNEKEQPDIICIRDERKRDSVSACLYKYNKVHIYTEMGVSVISTALVWFIFTRFEV